MMVDLERLREALAYLTKEFGPSANWPEGDPEWVEYRPLAAAARELLAGKKVDWCETHNSQGYPVATSPRRCFRVLSLGNWKIDPPCRMVEALLTIPDEKEL